MIRDRLETLLQSVRQACERAGRDPGEIQIVLVTKTVSEDRILEAFQCGITQFGENRVQELVLKKKNLPPDIEWHMIGHLQTNKVKQLLGEVILIHSLDRLELVEAIEREAEKKKIEKVPCLIQVNMSREAAKYGVEPEKVEGFLTQIRAQSPVEIRGLMTIGPLTEDRERIRECFRNTRLLRDRLREKFSSRDGSVLSMGMSGDYTIAVEEGATLLRIGTAVFGAREKQ